MTWPMVGMAAVLVSAGVASLWLKLNAEAVHLRALRDEREAGLFGQLQKQMADLLEADRKLRNEWNLFAANNRRQ